MKLLQGRAQQLHILQNILLFSVFSADLSEQMFAKLDIIKKQGLYFVLTSMLTDLKLH